jgi:hypothetical protein
MSDVNTSVKHSLGSKIFFNEARGAMWGFIADKTEQSGWHKAGYIVVVPGVTLLDEALKVARDTSSVGESFFKGWANVFGGLVSLKNCNIADGVCMLFLDTPWRTARLGFRMLFLPLNFAISLYGNPCAARKNSNNKTANILAYKEVAAMRMLNMASCVEITEPCNPPRDPTDTKTRADAFDRWMSQFDDFKSFQTYYTENISVIRKEKEKDYLKKNFKDEYDKKISEFKWTPENEKKFNKDYNKDFGFMIVLLWPIAPLLILIELISVILGKRSEAKKVWLENQVISEMSKLIGTEHRKKIKKEQSDSVKKYVEKCKSEIKPEFIKGAYKCIKEKYVIVRP